ncbi:D-alanyl-D-alanine carboxypeptidase family protein [Oricola sp.]|uniref:D-alanyl-D-alanine carboxypeptidase family protein n=1 Tax=Oricola sp. TaxID=1979950 RepID=UPI003BAA1A25
MLTASRLCLARWAVLLFFVYCAGGAAAAPSVVIEASTGRVLHAEDVFVRWPPASVTKLMTAYVAFREVRDGGLTMQSPVRVSLNAARQPPSHMAYPVGTIVTLDNALKMLIVKSANDIAVAIGESVSGTEEEFVARMNAEAKRIGMTDTRFANPHGLHSKQQYTTARDLALLARTILREFPQHAGYFKAEAISTADRTIRGHNQLLGRFEGANGMKTGYVCEAGFNLAASATRQDTTLIAIVLGEFSPNRRARKTATLLDAGFREFTRKQDQPLLQTMQKPDGISATPVNMREIVCSKAARTARSQEKRGSFGTPLLKALDRKPIAIAVRTGGAIGSSRSATMLFGQMVRAIPAPVQRPERISLVDEEDRVKYALKPGFDVPVPEPRPET